MIRGSFPAYLIPLIGAASGTLSIIIVYFLSQYYHHEPPFPRTWISATADHYPEFVVFRIGTISGSVFLVLSYLVNHFWVRQVGFENAFRVRKYQPRIGMILGIMGGLALMGSTANLNTGKHKTSWHVACATSFFILSIFAQLYNTFVQVMLYSNKLKGISKYSTYAKVALSIATVIQMYMELTNKASQNSNDVLSNILQYSLAFSILGFVFITAWDVRSFSFSYEKRKQQIQ